MNGNELKLTVGTFEKIPAQHRLGRIDIYRQLQCFSSHRELFISLLFLPSERLRQSDRRMSQIIDPFKYGGA